MRVEGGTIVLEFEDIGKGESYLPSIFPLLTILQLKRFLRDMDDQNIPYNDRAILLPSLKIYGVPVRVGRA